MDEDPSPEPVRSADAIDRSFRQPFHRPCLPVRGPSTTFPALGPPAPVVDESIAEIREPPADIHVSPFRICVTLEIPGASCESPDVDVTETCVTVRAKGLDGRTFRKELVLPESADPTRVKATYRNGVLDLTIPRRAASVTDQGGDRSG